MQRKEFTIKRVNGHLKVHRHMYPDKLTSILGSFICITTALIMGTFIIWI